jgi:hypothetical protein
MANRRILTLLLRAKLNCFGYFPYFLLIGYYDISCYVQVQYIMQMRSDLPCAFMMQWANTCCQYLAYIRIMKGLSSLQNTFMKKVVQPSRHYECGML